MGDAISVLRWFLFPVLGGFGGYLYYKLVGCASGSCPIASNPVVSILLGTFMGLALAAR